MVTLLQFWWTALCSCAATIRAMYLDGYTPEQILEAQHRSMRKKYQRKREEAATEAAVQAQIEKQLEKAVSKALDDIFKDWK